MNKLIDDVEEKPEKLNKHEKCEKLVDDLADFRKSVESALVEFVSEFVDRLARALKQHKDLAGVNGLAHESATIKLANRIKEEMISERLTDMTHTPTPEKAGGEGKEENEQ